MIFSYLDYVSEEQEYSKKGLIKNIKVKRIKLPKNYELFFKTRGLCPSCGEKAEKVYSKPISATMGSTLYISRDVWECKTCGWWETFENFIEEYDYVEEVDSYHIEKLNHGILKRFKTDDKDLPLKVLLEELKKNKEVLYDIHYYKMEQLSQYVFSQFYNCEVKHVGKTGDGGKDLIIVYKENPILVQVKRRTKAESTESVSTIRDFLGTMFIEDSKKGIIVSTAKHFTSDSIKVREQLLEKDKLELFELYDFDRFCSTLELSYNSTMRPWHNIVKQWK